MGIADVFQILKEIGDGLSLIISEDIVVEPVAGFAYTAHQRIETGKHRIWSGGRTSAA